jgi:hypothetical protein
MPRYRVIAARGRAVLAVYEISAGTAIQPARKNGGVPPCSRATASANPHTELKLHTLHILS